MPKVLDTIKSHIVKIRKKDTIFIGFNPIYAKVSMGIPLLGDDKTNEWLDSEKTNWDKREEFKRFMIETMPNITLTDVYDDVPIGYIEWPFLGTIAIDVDIDSPEYNIINDRYEASSGEPYSLDAVVYIMTYEEALSAYEKQKELEV
ncbi:MAG: hypothetical protein PHT88_05650 [Candidatus Moranbacteria bacterium]|nr:hypothetical protein [Candidatus Moranbacteria bacterium]